MQRIRKISQRITLIALLLAAGTSHAALGANAATISSDATVFKASRQIRSQGAYQVHELTIDGTLVREYVNDAGTVFAVSWQGQFAPNLRQLLGDAAFQRLGAAGQAAHPDHQRLQVQDSDLVIQSSIRVRSASGRAYLPAAFPAGVTVDQIQ